jgi:hypothetical protein
MEFRHVTGIVKKRASENLARFTLNACPSRSINRLSGIKCLCEPIYSRSLSFEVRRTSRIPVFHS